MSDDHDRARQIASRSEKEWAALGSDRDDDIRHSFADSEGKRIVKEAIKEWLDDQFASFGKWSALGIAAAALGVLGYFLLTSQGWHK